MLLTENDTTFYGSAVDKAIFESVAKEQNIHSKRFIICKKPTET